MKILHISAYLIIIQFQRNPNICSIHRQRVWTDWWGRPAVDWWGPTRCLGYWKCRRRLCRWSSGGQSCWWCRMEVSSSPGSPWGNSDTPAADEEWIPMRRSREGIVCWANAESHLAQDQRNHHSHEELWENGGEGHGGRRAKLEEQDQAQTSSISLINWYKKKYEQNAQNGTTCKQLLFFLYI